MKTINATKPPVNSAPAKTIPVTLTGPRAGEPVFMRRQDVAAQFGIAPRTLSRWVKRHRLPFYRLGPRTLFNWTEVAEFIKREYHVAADPSEPLIRASGKTAAPRREGATR